MSAFGYGKAQEALYARNLRKIAKEIDRLAKASTTTTEFIAAMDAYAIEVTPLAEVYATKMITDASKRNLVAWVTLGKKAGQDFTKLIRTTSTGSQVSQRLAAQVEVIKTLPASASLRAQELAVTAVTESLRAEDIALEVAKLGDLSPYEATRIARTEIARTNAEITQQRASEVGCDEYIWRSVSDSNSRSSHVAMDGQLCRFSSPPNVDGDYYNAGEIYNCRCFAEPVLKV